MGRWLGPVAAALLSLLVVAFLSSGRVEKVERGTILMDTAVRVVAYGERAEAEAAVEAALAELARLEQLWHPNRPDSDLYRVNAAAGLHPVPVDPATMEAVAAALELAHATAGAFDPTIGPLVQAWGFGSENRVPSPAEQEVARAQVDWRRVQLDPAAGSIYLERPGMALDLGAIAKGIAAERGREVLRERGIAAGLVQVGGSVATLGRRPDGDSWSIAVQHPRQEQAYLTVLSLGEAQVDTAGDYQRYFTRDGVRYHHILDPSTGAPARGVAGVTVFTDRTAPVDGLATAAFVLGMERGYQFLTDYGVSAILVSTEGEVRLTPGLAGRVKLNLGNWP